MAALKDTEVVIQEEGKETIQERLRNLFKGRNMRQVAKDWGLPYSTLNNYFSKGAKPGLDVVESICNVENISLQWLITGSEGTPVNTEAPSTSATTIGTSDSDPLKAAWNMIFDSIDRSDAEALVRLIYSNGAKGIIALATATDELNQALQNLPDEEKERLLALHEAKKGASEGREMNEPTNPATDKRQVG